MTQQIVAVERATSGKHELCQLTGEGREKAVHFKNREDTAAPLDGSFAEKIIG